MFMNENVGYGSEKSGFELQLKKNRVMISNLLIYASVYSSLK